MYDLDDRTCADGVHSILDRSPKLTRVCRSIPVFGSCFIEGSFVSALRRIPALPTPQAFRLSEELPASVCSQSCMSR